MDTKSQLPHPIINRHCVTAIYEYFNKLQQVKLQALNKRHYNKIIPSFLAEGINTFSNSVLTLSQN